MGDYVHQEYQEIQAELQAISGPRLLCFSDALETITRSCDVGSTLEYIPLTNINGYGSENLKANREISDDRTFGSDYHPSGGLSFPVDCPHRLHENDNHLVMQEIRMIHRS